MRDVVPRDFRRQFGRRHMTKEGIEVLFDDEFAPIHTLAVDLVVGHEISEEFGDLDLPGRVERRPAAALQKHGG